MGSFLSTDKSATSRKTARADHCRSVREGETAAEGSNEELSVDRRPAKRARRDKYDRAECRSATGTGRSSPDADGSASTSTSTDASSQEDQAQGRREKIEHTNSNIREATNSDSRRIIKGTHEERVNQAIAALKRLFPGVQGRLADLCHPTHRRFDLAVTVAAGKTMDAIASTPRRLALIA